MNIVILGAPGAGKGTQADIIMEKLHLVHVATGDLFRQALAKETPLGLQAKSYMEKGQLVPDKVTINMVLERIAQPDCISGCLFDGFPRNLGQAKALDKALGEQGKAIDKAVYVMVPDEELVRRLSGRWICRSCQTPYHMVSSPPRETGKCDKCGGELYQRSDDNEKTVRERLKVFFAETVPIINYYKKQDKLAEIDGNQGISRVAREMVEVLQAIK
ncbi:MAG: adenylate kinase [Chloroflexota bacterium]|nr:adenylate kinase [Chloroflexota bacterium]